MRYEEYAEYERARLAEARRKGMKTEEERRRQELAGQLVEVLDSIEGRLSRELAAELQDTLKRLAS